MILYASDTLPFYHCLIIFFISNNFLNFTYTVSDSVLLVNRCLMLFISLSICFFYVLYKKSCMVRPLKMAVPLLSVRPLPKQRLLHLHPTHRTDLPANMPQAPAGDCSYHRAGEVCDPLLVSLVTNEPTFQFPYSW